MSLSRYLGGSWASVHGPAEARSLLLWVLDSGFRGLVPGPGPRPVDWRAVGRAAAGLPAHLPALRLQPIGGGDETEGHGLASTLTGESEAARTLVERGVASAHSMGISRLILDLGRVVIAGEDQETDLGRPGAAWTTDKVAACTARRRVRFEQALDATCRSLHGLLHSTEDVLFCLTPGRHLTALGDQEGLRHVFDDLRNSRLRYWHDTAVTARRADLGLEEPGAWLQEFSNLLEGISLGDPGEGGLYLPPGAGGVDYPLLRSYVPRLDGEVLAVIELDPSVDPAEIAGAHAFLDKIGL